MRSRLSEQQERLRRRYLPKVVRLLLVGEAPPASGRFFYHQDSGLYRAIRRAYLTAFPRTSEANFLKDFCRRGCYLVDLCGRPVDQLAREERLAARRKGEPHLSRAISRLAPHKMVVVLKSIVLNVNVAAVRAAWRGEVVSLPYPGRWNRHRKVFEEQIIEIFGTLNDRSVPGESRTGFR
jgi:uracil-DNA glycosylase